MSDNDTRKEDGRPHDEAVETELKGVPEEFLEDDDDATGEGGVEDALAALRADLDAAKQDVLYARADTQNVRRRLEKDVQDARSYAATGFARDILSVSDNLARALDHVPAALREDEQAKRFVEGIEATMREIEKVFAQHGITRIAAKGMPLDPNQHQAMMEVPAEEGQEPGTIVQELQSGYMIKDRLLRPAMVSVAK
ncbi:nucleotide exchange factor GrpE [Pelagerythrobacter sp.]|uniref:nucleotide exchange factor GrpE n=1 Tax=Pelagerythrobacter sp. TaxID=2800702 RepID=UPI0035B1CB8C